MTNFDISDIKYTEFHCETCHGQGEITKRLRGGNNSKTHCRRCNGTGLYADAAKLIPILKQMHALQQGGRSQELVHYTTINKRLSLRLIEVGVELMTDDENKFIFVSGGDNHLVVAVAPKDAVSREWKVKDAE
jgi:hypothetical protein